MQRRFVFRCDPQPAPKLQPQTFRTKKYVSLCYMNRSHKGAAQRNAMLASPQRKSARTHHSLEDTAGFGSQTSLDATARQGLQAERDEIASPVAMLTPSEMRMVDRIAAEEARRRVDGDRTRGQRRAWGERAPAELEVRRSLSRPFVAAVTHRFDAAAVRSIAEQRVAEDREAAQLRDRAGFEPEEARGRGGGSLGGRVQRPASARQARSAVKAGPDAVGLLSSRRVDREEGKEEEDTSERDSSKGKGKGRSRSRASSARKNRPSSAAGPRRAAPRSGRRSQARSQA